jgi:hypothetical protein
VPATFAEAPSAGDGAWGAMAALAYVHLAGRSAPRRRAQRGAQDVPSAVGSELIAAAANPDIVLTQRLLPEVVTDKHLLIGRRSSSTSKSAQPSPAASCSCSRNSSGLPETYESPGGVS